MEVFSPMCHYAVMELILIAIALSMDAFSVSLSCGMKLARKDYVKFLKISLFFGLFQAVMPLGGYLLSHTFLKELVTNFAHWLSFGVFLILGIKTLYDYLTKIDVQSEFGCNCEGYRCLTTLAIATSIDAFLVGALLGVMFDSLILPIVIIGVVTFIFSFGGCLMGNHSLSLLKRQSQLIAALLLFALSVNSIL